MSSDSRIENDVQAALQRDPRVKRPELIVVSVDEIGTVVLRGAVSSLPQREAAVHDARQVDGVFEVIADHLKVHPPVARQQADDEIFATATEMLISDSRIHSDHIHVKVSHGQVTLTGYVRKEAERIQAAGDVESVPGVMDVRNRIEVR